MSSFTVTKTRTGTNEDGSPRYDYAYEGPPDGGLLRTGPIAGSVVLPDGTAYNVTEDVIGHEPGHAGPIMHAIAKIHEQTGGLGPDFTHTCDEKCEMPVAPPEVASPPAPSA